VRAPPILWAAAGRPDPRRKTKPATGVCYWCAATLDGEACVVADVIGDTFTDQDQARAPSSPWLCVGCAWAMTGRPPDTLRLWSIAYREDGVGWPANHPAAKDLGAQIHAQNKADPTAFRALLLDPPVGRWICSIADSGQIHTLPYAPVNHGRVRYGVRYERSTIWTTTAEYARLDAIVRELMAAGFNKGDIADEPTPGRLLACGVDLWMRHRAALRPHRGGALLTLVLFLSRKDKTDDVDRPVESVGRATRARDDEEREHQKDQADRLVDAGPVGPRDSGPVQRSLFGDGLDHGPKAPARDAAPHDRRRARRPDA